MDEDKIKDKEEQEIESDEESSHSVPDDGTSQDKEEETEEPEEEKMEEEQEDKKEEMEEDEEDLEEDEDKKSYKEEVKFSGFNPNEDRSMLYQSSYTTKRGGMKKFVTWIAILAILALGVGFFATSKIFKGKNQEVKITTEEMSPSPTSTPQPQTLNRSEWSLEVLNGSGVSGLAKKIADQIKALGYPVVKVGNADKDTYETSQIFVQAEMRDKLDLVIVDLKDIIKIASVAGELHDSTASARIIIGKN